MVMVLGNNSQVRPSKQTIRVGCCRAGASLVCPEGFNWYRSCSSSNRITNSLPLRFRRLSSVISFSTIVGRSSVNIWRNVSTLCGVAISSDRPLDRAAGSDRNQSRSTFYKGNYPLTSSRPQHHNGFSQSVAKVTSVEGYMVKQYRILLRVHIWAGLCCRYEIQSFCR